MRLALTSPRRHRLVAAAAGVLMLLGVTAVLPHASEASVKHPCGTAAHAPKHWRHVIWLVMENRSYSDVIGKKGSEARRKAPYLNKLARECGRATNYSAVTHPSLPNYLALTAGSTFGIKRSCYPSQCAVDKKSLFQQVRNHDQGWRAYSESMRTPCRRSDRYPYVVRHNVVLYYDGLRDECPSRNVGLGKPSGGNLLSDLEQGHLRAFSLITPNQCHNSHNCSIMTADDWMSRLVPQILDSRYYRKGRTALFIVYDEGPNGQLGQNCRKNPDRSCHVAAVVVSPSTPRGTRYTRFANHYALLETTERMLDIHKYLRHAGDRKTRSMTTGFGL